MSPKEAAICFTSVAVYYNPSDQAPLLGPEIVRIRDYVRIFFKKKTTINIVTKEDLDPLILPICGGDRNKVIVFDLLLGNGRKRQRTVLKELDICHSPSNLDSKANTGCNCQPAVFAIVFSLTLMIQNLYT